MGEEKKIAPLLNERDVSSVIKNWFKENSKTIRNIVIGGVVVFGGLAVGQDLGAQEMALSATDEITIDTVIKKVINEAPKHMNHIFSPEERNRFFLRILDLGTQVAEECKACGCTHEQIIEHINEYVVINERVSDIRIPGFQSSNSNIQSGIQAVRDHAH